MADDDSTDKGDRPDPFDTLDPNQYRNRQGDPFEGLGDESGDRSRSDTSDSRSERRNRRDERARSRTEEDANATGTSREFGDGVDDGRGRSTDVGETNTSTGPGADGPTGGGGVDIPTGSGDTERETPDSGGGDLLEGSGVGTGSQEGAGVGTGSQEGAGVGTGSQEGAGVGTGSQEGAGVGTGSQEGVDGSAFEEVDVGGVNRDGVWKSLVEGPEASTEEVAHEEVEVSKHSYCEGCEYFSPPPDVHCTHGGTEILEFVGMDNVRVRNCPVVVEERELGEPE